MQTVLTLICPAEGKALNGALTADATTALVRAGAAVEGENWLARDVACDIPFSGIDPIQGETSVRQVVGGAPIDVVVQPVEGRRKSLLVADMDSTIVTSETLDELAAYAGIKDKVAEITRRAMNGEIDFKGALRERVGMLKGLPAAALETTYARIALTPGATALVQTMRAHGAYTALVSGGFTFFTGRVAALVGFDEHRGNILEVTGGLLTGTVAEPILDKDSKLNTLQELIGRLRISPNLSMAVGDGANDLPMLQAAGLGVAFRAKPITARGAAARIDHAGLEALLYIQGYKRNEFSA